MNPKEYFFLKYGTEFKDSFYDWIKASDEKCKTSKGLEKNWEISTMGYQAKCFKLKIETESESPPHQILEI